MSTRIQIQHPGPVFRRRHLKNVTIKDYAAKTGLSRQYWGEVLRGRKRVTAKLALCMGQFSNTEPAMWAGMQSLWDVEQAKKNKRYRR